MLDIALKALCTAFFAASSVEKWRFFGALPMCSENNYLLVASGDEPTTFYQLLSKVIALSDSRHIMTTKIWTVNPCLYLFAL